MGLCQQHTDRYCQMGKPGGAMLPETWHWLEVKGLPVPVRYDDETVFRRWCAEANPAYRVGVINLVGLAPTIKAEFKWGLYAHT